MIINKVVHVPADFFDEDELDWATDFSQSKVNAEKLSNDLREAIDELNADGYEVINITPVISGSFDYQHDTIASGGYGYGYGFSYTDSLIVVAKKID